MLLIVSITQSVELTVNVLCSNLMKKQNRERLLLPNRIGSKIDGARYSYEGVLYRTLKIIANVDYDFCWVWRHEETRRVQITQPCAD